MDRVVPVAAPATGVGWPSAASPISRRRLLAAGGSAAAALVVADGVRLLDGAAGLGGTRGLRRSDYAPFVGKRFGLAAPGVLEFPVRLDAVESFPGSPMRHLAGADDAFTLIFHAPPGAPRPGQAVMGVRHPNGWSRSLLISPTRTGRHGLDYAAVINRARPN